MISFSRRTFLKSSAAGGAAALWPAFAEAKASGPKPRYIVGIMMMGGFDSILTVDPKDQSAVKDNIDCGYRPDERARGKNRFYGPLMGSMLRHEEDLCLVHGVRVDTVAHQDGMRAIAHGHAMYVPSSPYIGDVLGDLLPGNAPIKHLALGVTGRFVQQSAQREYVSPSLIHIPTMSQLPISKATIKRRPWAQAVEAFRVQQSERVFSTQAAQTRAAYDSEMKRAAALGQLLEGLPEEKVFSDPKFGDQLHLALHALKHDRAKCIFVGPPAESLVWFDTHSDTMRLQTLRLRALFDDVAKFIDRLKTEKNAFGPLIEQTTIVMGSEIGRFPRLNAMQGKDHWPENSWIVLGRGVRTAPGGVTIGATDEQFRGIAIDHRSGDPTSTEKRPLFVDSIFATLVKLAGGDPKTHGFGADDVLECVLA
jgi:uncharacterized protein (DUF1501 family)